MCNTKDDKQKSTVVEINNWNKRTHFNIQTNTTKPYDIERMTGKPSNDKPQKEE